MKESAHTEQSELPCIWVLAGVLSYGLCDRYYDCENCELYRVLRGRGIASARTAPEARAAESTDSAAPAIERRVSSYIWRLTAGCELYLDRPYCACHFWLRRSASDQVELGLDGHLLRTLYPIKSITLPQAGVLMKRDDPCGWITRGRVAIPLTAPITGVVTAVNEAYLERIRSRGGINGGDDWLLALKAHEDLDTVGGLYRGEQTLTWYLRKIQLLKRYLRETLVSGNDEALGITLSDGGERNPDLEQVLGRERFEALVDELFRMQITK